MVTIRGLPTKTTFARGVLSRQEITQRLKERIHNDYSPGEVQGEALVLKRMGLIPVDADYEKLLFDLLSEQVAGFTIRIARRCTSRTGCRSTCKTGAGARNSACAARPAL